MNSAKVFSVVSLASATTVASFMALMIFRGNLPVMQMVPFIGLNGAIVGGLFYLGIDAITSFSEAAKQDPKLVMVRNGEGRVLSIESQGPQMDDSFGFFGERREPEFELETPTPFSERLGLSYDQMIDTIKTVMLVALIVETYMGVAFISNNWTPFMVVTTGSMQPTLHPGDLIYVKGVAASDLQVGDVITFRPPSDYISGVLITHRIAEKSYDLDETYFKTKGDNNPSVDPWTVKSGDIVGRQTALVKGLGSYFIWMQSPAGLATLSAVLVLYLFWPNIMQSLGGKKIE
ncbi:signal peptidase I [Candidatus Bathyarchaeota archaeon]|nr:signal peptidase I [Candidatus Bathyarchaeota archaeon]